MDIIFQNPFRVLGIPVTATDREIAKQINDIAIYAEMDKLIEYDSDNFFSIKPSRTYVHIQEAKQKIEQPNNKLFYSLFWFWENANNTIDVMAFEELKNGNIEKAIEFWNRETEKGITPQNKSNHKNLSILQLGLSAQNNKLDKTHFLNSLALSGDFLANGHFEEFTNQVLGIRHSVDLLETTNQYVDEIISMVKPHLSQRKSVYKVTHKELLTHFRTYPSLIQNDIIEKFTGKQIYNIEKQIEKCGQVRNTSAKKAIISGFDLHKNSYSDLKQLRAVLSKTDLKFQLIADKLADELIACSIAYFNKFRDTSTDPGDDALKLAKYAKKIAVGDDVNDRIKEGIPVLREFVSDKPKRRKLKPVKSDINYIYKKLNDLQSETELSEYANIAKRFLNNCKPRLDKIKNELGKTDQDFLELSDIVIDNAMGMCMELMVGAIKVANNKFPYSDYERGMILRPIVLQVDPVFDMIGKLEMSQSQRKEFTDICDHIGFTPKSLFKPKRDSSHSSYSSASSSKDGDCYIATMVYGSFDASEVLVLRDFRDSVLVKNKFGRNFVNTYYLYSPKFVELTKDIKIIHSLFKIILDGFVALIRVIK